MASSLYSLAGEAKLYQIIYLYKKITIAWRHEISLNRLTGYISRVL